MSYVDADDEPLEVGAFYWVQPAHDVDLVLTDEEAAGIERGSDAEIDRIVDHWTQQEQPARYAGKDRRGADQWQYLGLDGDGPHGASTWPVRWIGKKLVRRPDPTHGRRE